VGNTTAAIGKGFAIGSAALTALALFSAYVQAVAAASGGTLVLDVMSPRVLIGLLIGGVVPFIFAADTMRAVGTAAFHVVEVTYDPAQQQPDAITASLRDAGYLDDLTTPTESEHAAYHSPNSHVFYRHTTAYAQTGHAISFAQAVTPTGRPLWPCPGMGPVKTMDAGKDAEE